MKTTSRIYVAGHTGLVGSALVRQLNANGYDNLVLRTRSELDLLNQRAVNQFFGAEKVEYVICAAAKVGGILANSRSPADFLYENITIAANVIHAAAEYGVSKLLYLGSSCIYPRMAPQPIKEECLLSGPLEPTNEGYALAKIAGLKLCEMYQRQYSKCFISAMPTNLYGPGDNFHPEHSHVIPGMLRRFHEAKEKGAKEVAIWGSGTPRREFLYVDDLADALITLMHKYNEPTTINVGTGEDHTIAEVAQLISDVVGYRGTIVYDKTKPDGTPRKLLDVGRMFKLGWRPTHRLGDGLAKAYKWAIDQGRI